MRELGESSNRSFQSSGGGKYQSSEVETSRHLHERVDKKEEQILKIESSVFQVANYYFVFQGVILTAIIKGSSTAGGLKCQHFWLPLSLSAIGAALNFGTLLMIAAKYKEALDELDKRILVLNKHLSSAANDQSQKKKKQQQQPAASLLVKQHQGNKAWRERILVLSMLLFSIFAALNLFAAWVIPCWST